MWETGFALFKKNTMTFLELFMDAEITFLVPSINNIEMKTV